MVGAIEFAVASHRPGQHFREAQRAMILGPLHQESSFALPGGRGCRCQCEVYQLRHPTPLDYFSRLFQQLVGLQRSQRICHKVFRHVQRSRWHISVGQQDARHGGYSRFFVANTSQIGGKIEEEEPLEWK
jgi:hypothetical protein